MIDNLCPSCGDDLDWPSGDGCANMTAHKNDSKPWEFMSWVLVLLNSVHLLYHFILVDFECINNSALLLTLRLWLLGVILEEGEVGRWWLLGTIR